MTRHPFVWRRVTVGLFLLGIGLGHAPYIYAQASSPNRAACEALVHERGTLRRPSALSALWFMLRLQWFPWSLVRAVETPIVTVQGAPPPSGPPADGANVIFAIDPPEDTVRSGELEPMRRRYAELSTEINAQLKNLRKIVGAKTVDDCVARAAKLSFDFGAFTKIAEERVKLSLVGQVDEARLADRLIDKVIGKLHEHWTVVRSSELMSVHEALRGSAIKNVIIVSHGLKGGRLVDSRLAEYPNGFFADLSPSLRSISVFACHAAEMNEVYHLADRMRNAPSQFATRLLIVSKGSRLGVLDEIVPVKALGSFLKKVDHAVSLLERRSTPHAPDTNAPDTRQCALRFERFVVNHGTFGMTLNGRFVGALDPTHSDPEAALSFPCAFEDRDRNILVIRSLSLLAPATLESPGFTVADGAGQPLPGLSMKHYQRADGSYQGSKLEFGRQ